MSWANYYQVQLAATASAREALAAARHVVATCAVPPIELEARWSVGDPAALATLAAGVRAIAAPAGRCVEFDLLPADLGALLELYRRCPHEVELEIGGVEPSPALSLTLSLARAADARAFVASVAVHLQSDRALASEAVRRALVDRLDACRQAGVLPGVGAAGGLVERFRAALGSDDRVQRLARGVADDACTLVCRSWRGEEPRVLTVVPERAVAPEPARVVALWRHPIAGVRGRARGEASIATAAEMVRILGPGDDDGIIELAVEVRGEPELDAIVDAAGDDAVVAAWWCGFDDWGSAYHGVRLALHGRYQDGRAHPGPGRHEVVVLVDAKRRDPDAFAATLAARAKVALVRAGSGL